jgi:predicted methyltransferase MtxX (methanogen marker protein 4)
MNLQRPEDDDDEYQELSAYQKLVSSFVDEDVLHKKKMSKKLAKKLKKKTTDTVVEQSTENSNRVSPLQNHYKIINHYNSILNTFIL